MESAEEEKIPEGRHWRVKQAAFIIGISHSTLYRWIDKGEVDVFVTKSGVKLISQEVLDKVKHEVKIIKRANDGHLPRNPIVGKYGKKNHAEEDPDPARSSGDLTLAEYKAELAAAREDEVQEHRKKGRTGENNW